MTHALIIDDNLIISRAIQDRLEAIGFNSFDHTWAEHQALEAAALHAPDLIVIGDTMAEGSRCRWLKSWLEQTMHLFSS